MRKILLHSRFWLSAMAMMGGLATLSVRAEEPWTPTQHELERYEHIWKAAPFIAATEVTPKGDSIAQRFALTGFARLGESEVVFLYDRKSMARFSVSKGTPQNGVELLAVAEKDNVKDLGAKIKAEGEVAEIVYDANLPAAGEAPGVAVAQPARPPSPNRPGMMSGGAVAQNGPAQPNLPPPPANASPNVMSGSPVAGTQVTPPAGMPRPVRVIRRRPIVTPPATEKPL